MVSEDVFSDTYAVSADRMRTALRLSHNFDIKERSFRIASREASIFFVDVFTKDEVMERLLDRLTHLTPKDLERHATARSLAETYISYTEVSSEQSIQKSAIQVLTGELLLILDGYAEGILIDLRNYPSRSIGEPEDERVLRGAHDGFIEAIKVNTSLIRRRIRDTRFCCESIQIGKKSKTDIALCYMDGIADEALTEKLRKELQAIEIPSLSMGHESLSECLLTGQRWNPFPRVRYTERPDHAAAAVLEGKLIVLIDNSPVAMILPTAIFDFVQDSNEYYFPPVIGTFLRTVRFLIFMATLLLVPIWYLLVTHPSSVPGWLSFIEIAEPNSVPLLFQILLAELVIDGVKIASLNTPSSLSNAFGIVGALVLGEFAVNTDLFVQEVLMYMAFVSVSTFVQPSFRLGYTFKLYRIFFLVLAALCGWWGFLAGVTVMLVTICVTRTFGGYRYLYPLIPFNAQACWRLLFRRSIHRQNS